MSVRQAFCLLALMSIGCSELPESTSIVEQTVTVTTFAGQEMVVPLTALHDATSGEPAFRSVLAIDRHRNRQTFVSLDELGGESQANARYVLVTSSAVTLPKSVSDAD